MNSRPLSLLVVSPLLLALACSADPAVPAGSPGSDASDSSAPAIADGGNNPADDAGATATAGASTDSGSGQQRQTAPSAAPTRPTLAADSSPPGVEPLSASEQSELNEHCDGLIKHLRKVSAQDEGSRARLERIHQLLAAPPTIAGTDVPRCAKLLHRSVVDYRAQTIESEGIQGIKRILVGLSMALSAAKPMLCPSASSVPGSLTSLAQGPQASKAADFHQPGWQCVRFQPHGPQHFQYELRTDAGSGKYQIMARGYPVDGAGPVELFLEGAVAEGAIELSSEVYRRVLQR